MDMKTFKTLEFAAIFGALGWFWWNQRQDRLRREDEAERKSAENESALSGEDSQDERG
jgi:hypothetical protein